MPYLRVGKVKKRLLDATIVSEMSLKASMVDSPNIIFFALFIPVVDREGYIMVLED